MSVHAFQVSFPMDSNLPKDTVTNTWHFNHTGGVVSDYDNVRDMLADFYTTDPTGSANSVQDYMTALIQSNAIVRAYNLDDPKPRPPVYESTFAISGTGGAVLPSEVALCMSYQSIKIAGESQARRRGRIYLGPFVQTANDSGGRPSSALITTVAKAARDLVVASDAATSWKWEIYSPTSGNSHQVYNGWVDNAWDTQRRRGLATTARTTWDDTSPA